MAPGRSRSNVGSISLPRRSQPELDQSPQHELNPSLLFESSVNPTRVSINSNRSIRRNTLSSSMSKKGRGRSRGLSLQKLTRGGNKVHVDIPGDYIRPVGIYASEFTAEVGILARTLIPASSMWRDVKVVDKEHIYQCLKDKFEIDTSDPHVILTIDDMIQHRLSDYRSDLYKHYKKFDTREEALQNAPLEVTIDEWKVLCERFSSDKFQKRSKINSQNKKNGELPHTSGSKSFVRNLYDKRNPETGQVPSEIDHYKNVYCRKMGEWVHVSAEANWQNMELMRNEPTPDGTKRSELEIMTEVLGTKSGYVRGLGHGAKLMVTARSSSKRSLIEVSASRRAENAEKENQQLRKRVDELTDEIRMKQTTMETELSKRVDQMQKDQQNQIQNMFQNFMSGHTQLSGASCHSRDESNINGVEESDNDENH